MHNWLRVQGRLESFDLFDIPVENFVDPITIEEMADGNLQTQPMTLREYMYPTRSTQPSCIVIPTTNASFELKSGLIQMLPIFRGVENENPYQHVREFEEICGTMKYNHMSEEALKLRLFPFSLKEKAKAWLYAIQANSINTWEGLVEAFYKKFYSKQKTAFIRHTLNSFHQLEGETMYEYMERFKDLLLQCPHHGFEKIRLVQILYEGLDYPTKTMVESFCNGVFTQKTADQAWAYLEEVAENTLQWEPIREDPKRPIVAERRGMHRVEPKFEAEAKLATLTKRLEVLEMNQTCQQTTPKTLESLKMSQAVSDPTTPPCTNCGDFTHPGSQCRAFFGQSQSESMEEVSALYQNTRYERPKYDPYSNTYNPGWKDNPNFSWTKGQYQGNPSQPMA